MKDRTAQIAYFTLMALIVTLASIGIVLAISH